MNEGNSPEISDSSQNDTNNSGIDRRTFLKKSLGTLAVTSAVTAMGIAALSSVKRHSDQEIKALEEQTIDMTVAQLAALTLEEAEKLEGKLIRTNGYVNYIGRLDSEELISTQLKKMSSADLYQLHGQADLSDLPIIVIRNQDATIPRIDNLPEAVRYDGVEITFNGKLSKVTNQATLNSNALDQYNLGNPYYLQTSEIIPVPQQPSPKPTQP